MQISNWDLAVHEWMFMSLYRWDLKTVDGVSPKSDEIAVLKTLWMALSSSQTAATGGHPPFFDTHLLLVLMDPNNPWVQFIPIFLTGWWFQTFLIFHNIWDVILPIDELIFFKMVKKHHPSIYWSLVWCCTLSSIISIIDVPIIVNHLLPELGITTDGWNPLLRITSWLVVWNMNFMSFHILGISSSQLTNSYFSEGQVYHQPARNHECITGKYPKMTALFSLVNPTISLGEDFHALSW